ncbi:hypothetical protein FSP39_004755 [Pinctada imbricata]|uniref:Trans-1,2-dihydrobenzene-1,2-diol dehydrogenase n=1 Tax=Pinctada imbricata TaxID=66713 RepID=A0AA89C6I6_PINIB|nr:hypothetical protein FSP39_004755 [Pinctada imbricata]
MRLRWGICGAGQISNDFCHALKTLPQEDHEITSIAARSAERARKYAETFQIRKVFTKYVDLASDSEIDIVYIGTWHITHVQLIKLMLHSGKHVLCEAPIAFTTEEVKEVFELAKQKNLFLMEAIWSRTFEIYSEIKKAIERGDIGEVKMVTANFGLSYLDHLRTVEEGGGVLLELGVCVIQFINWVFNNEKPECIKAIASIGEKGRVVR